jgi:sugar lactone lactonase YvrE
MLRPTSIMLALLVTGCSVRPSAEQETTPEPPPPPTILEVTASPADAQLVIDGSEAKLGSSVESLPGTHTIELSRKGFESITATVEITEGTKETLAFALPPSPHELRFTSYPDSAAITLLRDDVVLAEGTAPFNVEVLAGPITLRSSLEGFADSERSFFVDEAQQIEECLDIEGQLLDCLWESPSVRSPKALAFTPDGLEIWTAQLNGTPSLRVYSVATGEELADLTLGKHGSVELEFSSDGTKLYVSQMDTATVWEVDHKKREILRTFKTKSRWTKVVERSADGTKLYASNWLGADVSEIDIESGELLRKLRTVNTPRGLWAHPGGERLYVAGFGDGKLDRIDLATAKRKTIHQGGVLRHLEADEERGRLYISDMRRGIIYVMDTETEAVTKLATTDRLPNTITLSPDGRLLFVSCRGKNGSNWMAKGPQWGSIMVFDALDGELLDVIVAGNQPTALDVSPDGSVMAFSDILDHRIRLYRVPSFDSLKAAGGGLRDVYKARLKK